MKNLLKIFLLAIALFNFSSCERDYQEEEKFPEGSDFKIINTAANVGFPLSYYYNGAKITDQSLFNTQTNYFRVNNGTGNVVINKVVGADETEALSVNEVFEQNKQLTYIVYDDPGTAGSISVIKVADNNTEPGTNMSKIRLGNFATNLPTNVDVRVSGQIVLSNIAPNSISDFVTVESGKTVDVLRTGTTTIVRSLSAINFGSQRVYTVILNGNNAPNGLPALKLTAFSNTL